METMLLLTKLNLNETQRRGAEDDLRVGDGTPGAGHAREAAFAWIKKAEECLRKLEDALVGGRTQPCCTDDARDEDQERDGGLADVGVELGETKAKQRRPEQHAQLQEHGRQKDACAEAETKADRKTGRRVQAWLAGTMKRLQMEALSVVACRGAA
jgi:hypothetical protein